MSKTRVGVGSNKLYVSPGARVMDVMVCGVLSAAHDGFSVYRWWGGSL